MQSSVYADPGQIILEKFVMPVIKTISGTIKTIGEFIFPRCCHLCGTKLSCNEECICPTCISRLPRTLFHRTGMNPMEQRFAGIFAFERASGHFFYSSHSDLSILMQDLKYRHYRGLAQFMGKLVAKELLTTAFLSDIDYIVPVPMHFIKKAMRGYNQTEEIAKGVHEITSIPIKLNLKATKPHKTQTKLSIQQRRSNTSGIFQLVNPEELKDKHILLLDDVCTTGSTLRSASESILRDSPSTKLTLLTIGVTF